MSEDNVLPERLKPGQVLRGKTGNLIRIHCTSKRNNEGEHLYKVEHLASGTRSRQLFSRDFINQEGYEEYEPT